MLKTYRKAELSRYTTFHVGGKADLLIPIKTIADLVSAVNFARKNKLEIFILGGGSNLLLPDGIIKKLVLKIEIGGLEFKNGIARVGAGVLWDRVVKTAVSKGYGGIENLSLIPGTVGGAVYQNIGAYGAELKDVLKSVRVFNIKNGNIEDLSGPQCRFGYRDSIFQHQSGEKYVILEASIELNKNSVPNLRYPDLSEYFSKKTPNIKTIRRAVIRIRRAKLVYPTKDIGTAGSFFKNPVIPERAYDLLVKKYPDIRGRYYKKGLIKISAGQLIEKSGWKGKRIGKVGVSSKHALVLVSYRGATSEKIKNLARDIAISVNKKFRINLEPEVKIV